MYPHHVESIEKLKEYALAHTEGLIAIILDGSIVKGQERFDSDIDAVLIVTEEAYRKRKERSALAEVVTGHCTYEGGYFDLKYKTKDFLRKAAECGSEPTRNSFVGAVTIYTADGEIPALVEKIGVYPKAQKGEKMRVFYANLRLNADYFMSCLKADDVYMRLHTVSELIYSVYRMILAENEALFPCNRRLEAAVAALKDKPKDILALAKAYAQEPTKENCEAFVNAYLSWSRYPHQSDLNAALSDYVAYYEEWWQEERSPFVNEW